MLEKLSKQALEVLPRQLIILLSGMTSYLARDFIHIEILTSIDKPRQITTDRTSMQGTQVNPNSNQKASQPQSYRLLDKLTNALKSKIMTRVG